MIFWLGVLLVPLTLLFGAVAHSVVMVIISVGAAAIVINSILDTTKD